LAAVAWVTCGALLPFGHEADHEAGAEVIVQLTETGDDVHDRRRGGILEVYIAGIDVE
jgi:hypothetical protein